MFNDTQTSQILTPLMISREFYLNTIANDPSALPEVRKDMKKFKLFCDAIICGHDHAGAPYILSAQSPSKITDHTPSGFAVTGSGGDKAKDQLIFTGHVKASNGARTLYECFDAKARAEIDLFVGKKWDACFVTNRGVHAVSDQVKWLIERIWSANRSPFKTEAESENLPGDWREQLEGGVSECLQILPRKEVVVRTSSGMIIKGEWQDPSSD